MKINVTDRDIRLGKRNSNGCCPVARAICKAKRISFTENNLWNVVSVGHTQVDVRNEHSVMLPDKVRTWINKFDSGEKVRPFSFIL